MLISFKFVSLQFEIFIILPHTSEQHSALRLTLDSSQQFFFRQKSGLCLKLDSSRHFVLRQTAVITVCYFI